MLLLALLASLFHASSAECPLGFDLVRNGDCYRQLSEQRNYFAPNGPSIAKADCGDFGALPVIIRDQEDHDYWVSVALADRKKGATYGFVMLGLECKRDERWQWTDGSEVDFKPYGYDEDLDDQCNVDGKKCMWTMDPATKQWKKWCNMYQQVDLYCTIAHTVDPVEPDRDCASFSYDDDDDICYQVGATHANWTEANNICHSAGGNVASIHNEQENAFLRRLAVAKGLIDGMMIGGTWNGKKIKWADGTKDDYKNFAKGFPLEVNGECLAMQTNNAKGQWVNLDCSTELPFACVRQTDAKTPACDGGLHKEEEIIFSPGFPTSSSEPCDFLLQVDPGMLVEVEILFLEANECCDHLAFFEGTLGGTLLAVVSGEEQGRTFRTLSSNVMRASWQPNGGVNVRGMMITFKGVPKS